MLILLLTTFITLILLVWFKTDFVVDWGRTFGLSKFVKEDEYFKERLNQLPLTINYPTFLKLRYNNFISKLVSCPLCVSFWISTLFCIVLSIFNPIIVLMIPLTCISSLILFGVVNKLVNLS